MYRELWAASCAALILGILCMAAGAVLSCLSKREEKYRGHAEARVVDIETERRFGEASLSEFRNCQVAVFEFFANGKLIKVRDDSNAYPCPYALNQRVRICYDPAHPERYEIETQGGRRRLGGILNVLGIVGLSAGCIFFLLYAARIEL